MKLIKEISFDEVVFEWLRAEWYDYPQKAKGWFSRLVDDSADLSNRDDNQMRSKLLWESRGEIIKALVKLPFKWYTYEIDTPAEFENLSIIPSISWYPITNKSFELKQISESAYSNKRHGKMILEIKNTLSDKEGVKGRMILVGSRPDKLTIIEGNHRASALHIYGKEKGYDFFPLRVIIGFSPSISLFPWSVERKDMENYLKVCEEMMHKDKFPYRQSTLAIVVNNQGKFLVVNKMAYQEGQWSFPGGGIDEGETPEQALKRELIEELESDKFEIAGRSKHPNLYDWPEKVVENIYATKGIYFRGTQLTQFFVKFSGADVDVKAGNGIRQVKWVGRDELKDYLIFPDQLERAEEVIREFLG